MLVVLFYAITSRGYGYFRDELYYLACGQHPAFGYVDQPPLVAILARLVRATIGASLPALRLLPAFAAGLTVWMSMEMARFLGGGRWARAFAGLATALAPVYLSIFSIFTMNAFDIVFWTAAVWIAMRALAGGPDRLWLYFGLIFGIGLENKWSPLFLGAGLFAGLLLARRGEVLRKRDFWLGWALAALLILPNIIWEFAHGWPTLEFIANERSGKITLLAPPAFLGQLVLQAGPLALPLAVAGLVYFFTGRHTRRVRALGWAALAVIVILTATHSKPYYVAPIYAFVFASGGVAMTALTPGGTGRIFRWLYVIVLVAGGLALAPLAKPLLPVETYVRYSRTLGIHAEAGEREEVGRLPQFFADMFGWRDLADTVAGVYRSLPSGDREHACIMARNYGEAGAIDFFGAAMGLPHAISGHNSYWMWGPGDCTGQVVIVIGGSREELERRFESVTLATTFVCRNCMPYENNNPIWIAQGMRQPASVLWATMRHYI